MGTEQCHLFLLYQQSMAFSVANYGLGLTTTAKTNLLKLNAAQNEEMRTTLSLNKQGMHWPSPNQSTYRESTPLSFVSAAPPFSAPPSSGSRLQHQQEEKSV